MNLIENRQIRIFISSTFRDMQPERDYLIGKVFPKLKHYCQERDVTLIELDLRWGISEEESKQGKVAEICLREIENTHPFFIGLLGERYGWIPTEEDVATNATIFDSYPWIKKDLTEGLSITEIEMQYGVLRSKEDINAFFYLRSPEMPVPDDFKEKSGSIEAKKLKLLKDELCSQKKYPVKDYSSIEDLGNKIEQDFKILVELIFPQESLSELEKERLQQKAFLKSRTGVYIAEQAYFDRLDDFIKSESNALVVTGESGMGKSALIANWIERNEKAFDGRLIYHFTGNSDSEGDYRKITQRLINEIKFVYGLVENEKEDFESLNKQQSKNSDNQKEELELLLLSIVNKEQSLIVLDGINQLAEVDNAKLLNWLPAFPQNVKVIYSTLSDDMTMEVFERRGYEQLVLQPLTRAKREQLITDYLKIYGKTLLPEQANRIAANKECENTLVLRTLLDELRIFGIYEEVDRQIDYYLNAHNISEFFNRVLERLEKDYNYNTDNFVKEAFSLIAVSRAGLSETEILEIMGTPPLYWSQFYHAISNHLVTKNGLITFSHQFLEKAVWKRYLSDTAIEQIQRNKIVSYFEKQSNKTNRLYDEFPYQLYELQNFDRLHNFLLDLDTFDYIYNKNMYELGSYWRALIETNKEKYKLKKYADLDISKILEKDIPKLYKNIGLFLMDFFSDFTLALIFLQKAITIYEDLGGKKHHNIATCLSDIGYIYYRQAKIDISLSYYQEALKIYDELYGENHPATATTLSYIGQIYTYTGNYSKALEFIQKSLNICKTILDPNHPKILGDYSDMGVVYCFMKNYEQSLIYHQKGLDGYILRGDHEKIAACYNNIGATFSSMKDYHKSLESHQKALKIRERIWGKAHPDTAQSYNNIGNTYSSLKDYTNALVFLQKAEKIYKEIFDENHDKVAATYNNIGSVYSYLKDYANSLLYFQKSIKILNIVFGENHPSIAITYDNIGSAYDSMEDYHNALSYYQKALIIRKQLFSEHHPHRDIAASYENIGDVYESLNDYSNAILYYQKALEIQKNHFGEKHAKTASTFHQTGVLYYSLGNYKEALLNYQKAIEIRQEILGENHPDTVSTCNNIGVIYENLDEYENALKYYNKAAEQGYALAQYNLGNAYFEGTGVRTDYMQAIEWYEKAAAQGLCYAQNDLGYIYHYGWGVDRDCSKAFEWYKKAVEQGYATSQYRLGYLYEKGLGIDKNMDKAIELYTKAAKQHEKDALIALKRLGINLSNM